MKAFQPGKLVHLRGRDWVVLPSEEAEWLIIRPLGGSEEETTGIYLPLEIESDTPRDTRFPEPSTGDLGDMATARLLYDAARLAFRNGAGPFRSLAKLSFRPRSYQMVPLIMALRQERVKLLVADDVGVGKTVESLLIIKELLERRKIRRFAVICLPHLCEQWQAEIREKLDMEAVIIRSNTQARLDREIQGDTSVYEYYRHQVISIDFIKSEARRDSFIEQCPEMVIVDEAHTCARPTGLSPTQQQRHHLVRRIAQKPGQHLILLTATPHSGKPEEFHSLLGMLRADFETLDLPASSHKQRQEMARYFVQRKRADVEKWMGEETPFPKRDSIEWDYDLSPAYHRFFGEMLLFARKLIAPEAGNRRVRKAHYWTALALLRGVMSSPAAGVEMLNARLSGMDSTVPETAEEEAANSAADLDADDNPVRDTEFGFESDFTPMQVLEGTLWSSPQRQQLRRFADELGRLANAADDRKLAAAQALVGDWVGRQFNPVIFCRYIATANYLGEKLPPLLRERFPDIDAQVVTSELPDEVRKQRIEEMGSSARRVLIATDCLSEGVNLQQHFTAVLHYDLPWNPNRLEQREGRVDRFGQRAPEVKASLLYGADNPIDGIVLDVLLRKVREIKRSTGINVPFPEDSQSIIDTITQALLLNSDRQIRQRRDRNQIEFNFDAFGEAAQSKACVTRKVDEAAEREKISRSIFAQNAIKAQEIEKDLREVDEAIGNPRAVEAFVTSALPNLLGVPVRRDPGEPKGHRIVAGNLPEALRELLPRGEVVPVSFESPTPEGFHYLGRNHPFVEQLCQLIMSRTLAGEGKRAARAAVIRTRQVETKTTLLLFRCRNVIGDALAAHQIVAEEMVLWGWRGTPQQKEFLDHETAKSLLVFARAASDLSPQARAGFLDNELRLLHTLREEFDAVAERRSQKLVEAHERFSALMDTRRFQVVHPVLPMDLLGIYLLLPEGGQPEARP